MTTETSRPLVEICGVSKRFPGVQALEDVSLDIRPGEVHAVAGENGAGKSTLMKLLSQLERPSDGTIEIEGTEMRFRNPRYAQKLGIAMVHQEFALAPHLTVADNLALGREQSHGGLIVRGSEKRRAKELLARVKVDINPARRVSSLSMRAAAAMVRHQGTPRNENTGVVMVTKHNVSNPRVHQFVDPRCGSPHQVDIG